MKVRTSVLIERDLLEKAKQLGLNVSQCLENCLKLYVKKIEEANEEICGVQTPIRSSQMEVGGSGRGRQTSPDARGDLNPCSPAPKAGALIQTWPRAHRETLILIS